MKINYKYKRYGKYYSGELKEKEIQEYLEEKEMVNVILEVK